MECQNCDTEYSAEEIRSGQNFYCLVEYDYETDNDEYVVEIRECPACKSPQCDEDEVKEALFEPERDLRAEWAGLPGERSAY